MLIDETRAWLAGRKEAGRRINPEDCEMHWWWAGVLDPYGILDLDEDNISRVYFVQSLDSDGWVELGDLPEETREVLRMKMRRGDFDRSDDLSWLE